MHQPGKAAVALQEENTPRQMAYPSPQLQSDMCQQPAHLAEVRACHRCIYAVCVPAASSEIRLPDLTELPQVIQVLGMNETISILAKFSLLISSVNGFTFKCLRCFTVSLIYFLFSPVVNNCQADAGMVLVTCTH